MRTEDRTSARVQEREQDGGRGGRTTRTLEGGASELAWAAVMVGEG